MDQKYQQLLEENEELKARIEDLEILVKTEESEKQFYSDVSFMNSFLE